jgi:predicted RNA-binding Zn ribbon-like protein
MPAAYVVIDGLEIPVLVSGHPGLELCNTFAGWNGEPTCDYLATYDHLATWAGHAGLLTAGRVSTLKAAAAARPLDAAAILDRARAIRGRLYEVALGRADRRTFARFAEDARAASASVELVSEPSICWRLAEDAGLEAPVLAAVWSAAQLLVSSAAPRITACPGSGCGWLFLNASGRRRWCTMSTCGNRAKARRFAARHRVP